MAYNIGDKIPMGAVGDAGLGDVVAGKTFSSAAGVGLTGTGANAKNYASGFVTSASGTQAYYDQGGSQSLNLFSVTITLTFLPRIIRLYNANHQTIYSSEFFNGTNQVKIIVDGSIQVRANSPVAISATVNTLPTNQSNAQFTYEAWE